MTDNIATNDGVIYPKRQEGDAPAYKGKYAQLHKKYLKECHKGLYTTMLVEGTLFDHLDFIQETAEDRINTIVSQLMAQDPPPDKATHPMEWVGWMNNAIARAEEFTLSDVVYN